MARWQIQTLTEPPVVPIAAPAANQDVTVEITQTVVTQYQRLAWGVFTPSTFTPVPTPATADVFRPVAGAIREALSWNPNTFFPERPQVDKFGPQKPDFIYRKPPNNVGDSFVLGELSTAPEPQIGYSYHPDYIFRRPPNNVGEAYVKAMNTFFPETVSVDRFGPSYPDFLFRRPPNNVGDPFFWGVMTPVSTVYVPINLAVYADLIFRRAPNNVGDALFWDPNVTFAERVSFDKFGPSYPDLFLRIPARNVGDALFWGELETAPEPEIGYAYYPDYLFRRTPNTVGDPFSWGLFTPATFPAQFAPSYPDFLSRVPPKNAGEPLSWDPNISFREIILADKWGPSYPVYIFRAPRATEFPALGSWNPNTPTPVVSTAVILFDIDHKRFFIQTSKPVSGAPYIRPL